MYECQAILCRYCTSSLYFPRLRSTRWLCVSAERPASPAIQSSTSFVPKNLWPPFGSRLDSEPIANGLSQSTTTRCGKQYLSIGRRISDLFANVFPQISRIAISITLKIEAQLSVPCYKLSTRTASTFIYSKGLLSSQMTVWTSWGAAGRRSWPEIEFRRAPRKDTSEFTQDLQSTTNSRL